MNSYISYCFGIYLLITVFSTMWLILHIDGGTKLKDFLTVVLVVQVIVLILCICGFGGVFLISEVFK